MWHASVAPARGAQYGNDTLRKIAIQALAGVGDAAAGEWEEIGAVAFHLRRRLTEAEALLVGPVIDVRGTRDGQHRCARIQRYVARSWWLEECG